MRVGGGYVVYLVISSCWRCVVEVGGAREVFTARNRYAIEGDTGDLVDTSFRCLNYHQQRSSYEE